MFFKSMYHPLLKFGCNAFYIDAMATSALRFESKRNVTNKTLYAQEQRKALCLSNSGNEDNT